MVLCSTDDQVEKTGETRVEFGNGGEVGGTNDSVPEAEGVNVVLKTRDSVVVVAVVETNVEQFGYSSVTRTCPMVADSHF